MASTAKTTTSVDPSCPRCGHGRFVVVPAAYVYLVRSAGDGLEVLLQRRSGEVSYCPHHWASAAAGHIEQGESPEAAARREALEELGVELGPLTPLTVVYRTGAGDPLDERVDFFFGCEQWTGEPRITEPHKMAELRWVPLSPGSLPTPMVPQEFEVLMQWVRGELTPVLSLGFE